MDHYVLSCCSTMDLRKRWAEEHGVNLVYAKFFLEGEAYQDDFYASISQAILFERMLSGKKSQTTQVNTEEYIGRISGEKNRNSGFSHGLQRLWSLGR